MNWLDKTISAFSPEAGLRRARARMALGLYSAAGRGSRFGNWNTASSGPNGDALVFDIPTLRDRSRDLVRNNPYAAKAVSSLVAHMISTGIQPRLSAIEEGDKLQDMKDGWRWFADQCDFTGDTDIYGLQALAARCTIESGSCLVLKRPAPSYLNLKVPMQLQLLEPDHLDERKNQKDLAGGGFILQGIEFDGAGRKVAYWLFDHHPGDGYRRATQSRRVPASSVMSHLFDKQRCGQALGFPWLAPAMPTLKDLADFNDAELRAKKLQACFAIITTSANPDQKVADAKIDPKTGKKTETIKPGMNVYNLPGDDVKFGSVPMSQGYDAYTNIRLHEIAAGFGIPYELMTGDLSQVNYSSYRAGYNDFKTRSDQLRYQLWEPGFCKRAWNSFYSTADAVGVIRPRPYNLAWTPPKYLSVDPVKDFLATVIAVRGGVMSLQQAIAENGDDADSVMKEIEAMNEIIDAKKFVFDTDPRKTAGSGAMQKAENMINKENGNG